MWSRKKTIGIIFFYVGFAAMVAIIFATDGCSPK